MENMEQRLKKNKDSLNSFLEFLSGELDNRTLAGTQKNILCFMGRPLALSAVKLYVEEREKNLEEEGGLFQVKVGDIRRQSEGLAGFFKEAEDNPFGTFYTYGDPKKRKTGYVRYDNHLEVGTGRKNRTEITMLYEPFRQIHLISGIFPVKKVQLPEDLAERLMGKLKYRILVNPVLCEKDSNPFLPLAVAEGKSWFYMVQEASGTVVERIPEDSSQTAYEVNAPLELLEGWLQLREEMRTKNG